MVRVMVVGRAVALAVAGLVATATQAAPALATAGQTNLTFAGYQLSKPATHVKSATATFTIPTISCKKNFSGVAEGVVIDSTVNKKTNSFVQTVGGIGAGCSKHQPEYVSIIDVDSTNSNDLVGLAPGDKVQVTVKTSPTRDSVTVDDLTAKVHKTRAGKGTTGLTADIGGSALDINNIGVGLDKFTPISVTAATINGKSLAAEKASVVTWVRTKRGKSTVLVTAGKLSKGKDFTVTFKHS
jgi:Peptidase A4 family